MNAFLSVILFVILLTPAATAQVDFRISGYAVNFPIYQRTNASLSSLLGTEQAQFTDVTRIRLRPSAGLWADAFIMLEYEISATYFSSPLPFPVSESGAAGQMFDLIWNPVKEARWNVVHFIDRLYVKQVTDLLDLTVGRQRISWGTGRIWNPTDLFNPINPTSFAKVEKDGVDAVLTKFVLGNFTDLSLVLNPRRQWKGSDAGVRFRTNLSGFDVSVMGGTFDRRVIAGLDFAGSIFDAGIRGEGIISGMKDAGMPIVAKYIFGVDNQFSEEFYALMEYHFNGQGKAGSQDYDLFALREGSILNLGRQFVAVQGTYLLHPLVSLTGGYINSMTDGSGFVLASVSYSATEDLTVSSGGQVFHGDDFDEYWYYPTSIYLRFDYFF